MLEENEWIKCLRKDLTCVVDSRQHNGAIYISSLPTAQSLPILYSAGIASVLTIAKGVHLTLVAPSLRAHLILPAEDHDNYNIAEYFAETFHFIEKGRKHGNVLVHCMAGVSCSAAIVAAYLIRKEEISSPEALSRLQCRRKQISPNPGFVRQLEQLQQSLLASTRRVCKTEEDCSTRPISPKMQLTGIEWSSQWPVGDSRREGLRMVESSVLERKERMKEGSVEFQSCVTEGGGGRKTKSRTLQKIERLKTSMVVDMVNSKLQGSANFSKLLTKNIYRNKLRFK